MEVRNIQRSGNTYYVYLPSAWCKANGIEPGSRVMLDTSSEGSLLISSESPKDRSESLVLKLGKYDKNVVNKALAAAYLNPVRSFKVLVEGDISPKDVLEHKKLLGGIDIIGLEQGELSCESLISIDEPDKLLRTMLSKMLNMISLLREKESGELIELYESEMDRSNLLITKAAVSSLMFKRKSSLRHIDLFYIAALSKNLEAIADQLAILAQNEPKALRQLQDVMRLLLKTLDKLSLESSSLFVQETDALLRTLEKTKPAHLFSPLRGQINNIAEVVMDWAVTSQIDAK